jgi:hypothetical protein
MKVLLVGAIGDAGRRRERRRVSSQRPPPDSSAASIFWSAATRPPDTGRSERLLEGLIVTASNR